MDNREWQTFVTVVNEGNMTKAAEKLFVSQPALSYRIRHIEADLGYSLLLRTADGITLTPQGEIFYEYCKKMLLERSALESALDSSTGKVQGTLKIASSINFADYQLPKLLRAFREEYPDVHIQVKTAFSGQVTKMFNAGDCMFAFARGGYQGMGKAVRLLDEPYCLVYKNLVPIKTLGEVPFIRYNTDQTVAHIIEEWMSNHLQNPPEVAMDVNSMVTCRHFVREGLGWSILTYMGLGSCKDENIFVAPLRHNDGTLMTRATNMLYKPEATKLVAVKRFIEFVEDYYESHAIVDYDIFTEFPE